MEENSEDQRGLLLNFQAVFIVNTTKALKFDVHINAKIDKGYMWRRVESALLDLRPIDLCKLKGKQFNVKDDLHKVRALLVAPSA